MSGKTQKRFLSEFIMLTAIFAIIAGFLGYMGYIIGKGDFATTASAEAKDIKQIIIDAGHGGVDGGATGINGRLEKELNLEISQKLSAYMKLFGFDVIMTRTDDISLGEDAPKGKKKMTDLVKRLECANNNPDALFLSIHMNKFPQEVCKGLQIWYSPGNDMSKRFADIVKNTVVTDLQNDNTRDCKKAGSAIYLLDRMKNTSILVECGFISNKDECAMLCDNAYQQKLAASISDAVIDFKKNVG